MFDPEYLDITCSGCHQREVYVDREMGFYCMFCGRRFSTDEVQLLIENKTRQGPKVVRSPDGHEAAGTRRRESHTFWSQLAHTAGRLFLTGKHLLGRH